MAISTGDIFRYNIKDDDGPRQGGQEVSSTPVTSCRTRHEQLVADRLTHADAEHGFLLDGYPRTAGQVQRLDAMLRETGHELSAVVELTVPDDELVTRLLHRAETRAVPTTPRRPSSTAWTCTTRRRPP